MSPSTPPSKRLKASRRRDTARTPSPSLPTPPRTPAAPSRSHRQRSDAESKAARALHHLRAKLRRRSDTITSSPNAKKHSSSSLLPAAVISTDGSKKKVTTKNNAAAAADDGKKTVPLGDVIEISSDENDNSRGRDDMSFRGRSTHSRVQAAKRSTTPLRTRGYFKRTGESLDIDPKPSSTSRKTKGNRKSKAAKKTVASEGEEDSEDASHFLSDTEDLPSVSEFLATLKKSKSDPVEPGDSSDFSAGEYDSDDSFIDNGRCVEGDDGDDVELPSDEEDQVNLATFHSIISKLSSHLPKEEYDATICEATRAFKSTTQSSPAAKAKKTPTSSKGKRKASPSVAFDIDDSNAEEEERDEDRAHTSHVKKKAKNSAVHSQGAQAPGPSRSQTSGSNQGQTTATPSTPGSATNTAQASIPVTPVATPGQPVTFATLIANTPGAASRDAGAKFVSRCDGLPDICGIDLPAVPDPILGPDYANLPKLRRGNIVPWTTTRGRPHPSFFWWATMIPKMNATLALEIIRFTDVGKYINPSRISPTEVHLKEIPGDPARYLVCRNRKPVYGVTLGAVSRSQLFSRSGVGMKQKSINIRGHEVEWPRWEGFMGMVTGEDPLAAQYGMNSIQMSTKSDFTKKDGQTTPLYSDEWTIDSDDKIPVYDARDAPGFNFVNDVSDIGDRVPMWNPADGELPRDSCVAVAYSMVSLYVSEVGYEQLLSLDTKSPPFESIPVYPTDCPCEIAPHAPHSSSLNGVGIKQIQKVTSAAAYCSPPQISVND